MAKIITPQTIKAGAFAYAFLERLGLSSSSPSLANKSNAPPVDPNVKKLEKCPEEFDNWKREAKFAFRPPDLSRKNYSPYWTVVVHFPEGNKTYLYQAWKDESSGLLQPGRAENVNKEVFEKATYFGTTETCPRELLEKAKQVSTGRYDALSYNCQTWTREFLYLTSPKLLTSLNDKIPATKSP